MPGKKKVTRIGCGRLHLAKPSPRIEPPRKILRTELAELIDRCGQKDKS